LRAKKNFNFFSRLLFSNQRFLNQSAVPTVAQPLRNGFLK